MFAVWLPEPLTVAIWMLKSLTTRWPLAGGLLFLNREICR